MYNAYYMRIRSRNRIIFAQHAILCFHGLTVGVLFVQVHDKSPKKIKNVGIWLQRQSCCGTLCTCCGYHSVSHNAANHTPGLMTILW